MAQRSPSQRLTSAVVRVEPTVTDWITAVSTGGALVAAVVAAWIAGVTFRHNRADRLADQAGKFAAWVEWRLPEPGESRIARMMGGYCACVLFNASPLPVYQVLATYELRSPGKDVVAFDETSSIDLVPPGEKTLALPSGLSERWHELGRDVWALRVGITFTDAADRTWTRGTNGVIRASKRR